MLRNDYIVFQYIFQYLGEKVYVFQYFFSSNLIPVEFQYFQYFQYRWPPCCIILNFNNDNPEFRKMLPLRPLSFALENRAQITILINEI